jgi:hypothetical protein
MMCPRQRLTRCHQMQPPHLGTSELYLSFPRDMEAPVTRARASSRSPATSLAFARHSLQLHTHAQHGLL